MRRYSWTEILQRFEGEWVELVEFDWDWRSPYPRWARVRHHSPSRTGLRKLIQASSHVEDSLTLYLGAVEGVIDHTETAAVL